MVAGDLVLMLCDQVAGSFLIAIDKDTGQERWRAERSGRLESWTTPVLYPSEQPESVLVFGSNWVDGYDLSSGERLWTLPGVGAGPIASPVVTDSLLLATSPNHVEGAPMPSYEQLTADVDEDGDGTLNAVEFARIPVWGRHFGWVDRDGDGIAAQTEWEFVANLAGNSAHGTMAITLPQASGTEGAEIIWSNEQSQPYVPSPLVYEGIVYLVRNGGIVQSLDLATGEVFKRGRTSQTAGSVYASPVAADDKIVIATIEGEVAVLKAGKQWEVLAVDDLDEPIYASPALAGDRIFVRTPTRLYCFGNDDRDAN